MTHWHSVSLNTNHIMTLAQVRSDNANATTAFANDALKFQYLEKNRSWLLWTDKSHEGVSWTYGLGAGQTIPELP